MGSCLLSRWLLIAFMFYVTTTFSILSLLLDEQNVSILTKADRCSLFLVQGERGSDSRCLVSKLFDVCSQSTLKEMEKKEEIHIPWGSGIVGYVAQSGEAVNIPDAYKVGLV
jgi:signal transduction protein with GAF and PtsI domain